MSVIDYRSAAEYLGGKTERPIGTGRATRIFRRSPETIAIRYQRTDVVTYRSDNTIILNSGGWQTVTTKARFSEYTRARVYSIKGEWFVRVGANWDDPTPPSLFYDGMIIDASGTPVEPYHCSADDRAVERIRKAI